jgi:ABC-type branched-subunit amino acid transport system substrate-binding protein
MQALLRVFEQMRERPRRRRDERLRPLLLITGPVAATRLVTQVLARRCGDRDAGKAGRKQLDPFARVDADVPRSEEVGALLRRISQELSEHYHQGEPPLRFPLLSMALWLQELREDSAHEELRRKLRGPGGDSRRVLRKVIRRRRPVVVPGDRPGDAGATRKDKVASLFTHIETIATVGVSAVTLLGATAASLLGVAAALVVGGIGLALLGGQIYVRTRGWWSRRRYRWFIEQRYLEGKRSSDFLNFAIRAVTQRQDEREIEGLLAAAFLQDLRQAYRRRWWRRVNRARVRYPVLLLDDVAKGTEGHRLITFIEEIRADKTLIDPLVVVAALQPTAITEDFARLIRVETTSAEIVDPYGVEGEWQRYLAGHELVAALGPHRAIRVEVGDDDAEMGGSASRFVDPPPNRPKTAHPVLPWLAMVAVLAGSLTVVGAQIARYCDATSVWRADNGECVGITDGSYVFNRRLAAVERRIHQLNEDVETSGRPWVEVVYLGPMSADPATKAFQPDLLAGVHGELVGLSMAQQAHNTANGLPRVRILLANAGDKFRYASEVARKIKERSASERRLVAAVGFGLSKQQTQEAIAELGQVALPMIGTTISLDEAASQPDGTFSPYFFRMAPSDQRLADHAAFWAKNGQLDGLRARTAAVFFDRSADELYSRDLAEDFVKAFGSGARLLPFTDGSEIPQRVIDACRNPADLFYYAGRSDEFQPFVRSLSTTDCGVRRTVLAGDEAAVFVTDNAASIGASDTLRLFYTPLAAREAWVREWTGNRPVPTFYSDYDTATAQLAGDSGERPSRTHAAIAHDAALVVTSVTQQIYGAQRQSLPTAGAVLAALTEPDPNAPPPQGASGLLRFGPRSSGHAVVNKPVLLAGVRPDGTLTVDAVCGQLTRAEPATEPPCPE